jgi:hypothetical protein
MGGKGVGAKNQQLKIRRLLPISPKSKCLSLNLKIDKIYSVKGLSLFQL